MALKDAKRCSAKAKRTGEQCQNPAVESFSVCRHHGAGTPARNTVGGRPVIHGRYSLQHRARLAEKQAQFLDDPSPGDLTGELALMRALLQEYIDRYPTETPLPAQEIERIFGMVEAISRIVERIAKILTSTALTQADLMLLQAVLVDEFKHEPERLDSIMGRLGQIKRPAQLSA
jgi:hypothetical protein